MSTNESALAAFIQATPPGELSNVKHAIKTITGDSSLSSLDPALKKHNEETLATVKLPGASKSVIVSAHNSLDDGRYYDLESQCSFKFDHSTQQASAVQSYVLESQLTDLIKSTLKSLSTHASEHYPSFSTGVYPIENDSKLAVLIVANKYSPSNFWNGRWRSSYIYDPSDNSISGTISVDVHYYEDGNVRLLTSKAVNAAAGSSASEIVKAIALVERKYQEELNRGFTGLSETAFKGLRRQLPVTRQKIEWDKIGGYRVGQDIGGTRSK